MINPLELLQRYFDDAQREYVRVYHLKYQDSTSKHSKYSRRFEYNKNKNLGEIKKVMKEYEETIRLLGELNAYSYLKED